MASSSSSAAAAPLLRLSLPTRKPYFPPSAAANNGNCIRFRRWLPPPYSLTSSTIRISLPPRARRAEARRPGGIVSPTASYNAGGGSPTPATDRIISAVAYFLPFFNGLQYGRFLFAQYPQTLGAAFEPLLPLLSLYRSVPYASFVAFFALYLGVVRNPSFSRYVRFNSMQAVVLDVLLVLPLLFLRIFSPGRSRIAFGLTVMAHNAIFVFTVLCFIYSLVYSILGRTPYLPFVAEAAGRQL
ncbi:protein TIC 20-II, chloroplastic [Diospyros lotus]|uniref:protein TIC 20-II, chloroplastic n=1 Tax=Diospyros lotus TaxID=55363 RepID=UPI00225835B3|nr:protein TIC 20-II, chloroplastic [Diospyros lotus]